VRFVLDASLATACFFADERDAFADAVRSTLSKVGAAVPRLWLYEMSNVLHSAVLRGRIVEADANAIVDGLRELPLTMIEQTDDEILSDVRKIADSLSISSYDAAYLHLCLSLDLPLGTLDGAGRRTGLKQAAAKLGIELLTHKRIEGWIAEPS
jgi:predicted nucleic acid-binding protein